VAVQVSFSAPVREGLARAMEMTVGSAGQLWTLAKDKKDQDVWIWGPAVMPGQLCSKSNSRQIVHFGKGPNKRPAIIKNAEARDYVNTFIRLFKYGGEPFVGDVVLKAQVYYADRRRDLDIALLQDCLQAGSVNNKGAGIILNDRQVVKIIATRLIDKDNPRTVFKLEQYIKPLPLLKGAP
jgi:hypothetical protein